MDLIQQIMDFKFFKISKVTNSNPAIVEFNLNSVTTNPGVAKTAQNSFGVIISKGDYPSI